MWEAYSEILRLLLKEEKPQCTGEDNDWKSLTAEGETGWNEEGNKWQCEKNIVMYTNVRRHNEWGRRNDMKENERQAGRGIWKGQYGVKNEQTIRHEDMKKEISIYGADNEEENRQNKTAWNALKDNNEITDNEEWIWHENLMKGMKIYKNMTI